MNQSIIRDELGRIVGTIDEWFNNEDESYYDFKEYDVRFPEYKGNLNGEVTITYIKNK